MVACKGSMVVAWGRGSLRAGLAGVLVAVAMIGAVGGLWLVASGDGAGEDAAAPTDGSATPTTCPVTSLCGTCCCSTASRWRWAAASAQSRPGCA